MLSKNQLKQVKLLEQKKHRQQTGLFVAEGPKVVGDLFRCGFKAHVVYATTDYKRPNNVDCVEITADELRKLSFLQHPQQVLAVFYMPRLNEIPEPQGLCLALDGVQDPGNLGTIIRIADWFGIKTIYCSEDTVDAWNPKVVQATMGSIARINLIYIDLPELLDTLPDSFPVYGTLLDGEDIYQQPLSENGLIIMGNEGNGISEAVRTRINNRLLIPSFSQGDTAESLNVAIATAITCSEFRRRKAI